MMRLSSCSFNLLTSLCFSFNWVSNCPDTFSASFNKGSSTRGNAAMPDDSCLALPALNCFIKTIKKMIKSRSTKTCTITQNPTDIDNIMHQFQFLIVDFSIRNQTVTSTRPPRTCEPFFFLPLLPESECRSSLRGSPFVPSSRARFLSVTTNFCAPFFFFFPCSFWSRAAEDFFRSKV